jgi:signal transduction histidine kinase
VRVRVKFIDTTVRIAVEDDGPGIPPETRDRVFLAGERLDEQTPGTGLGLAIVRDVTSLYGGSCWIETSEFGGAAVILELPVSGHSPSGMTPERVGPDAVTVGSHSDN